MWKKLPDDSFLLGLLTGLVSLFISYQLMRWLRMAAVSYYGNPYVFPAPRIQLICILLNILLFRFALVRFKMEKTGKGILLITVLLSFTYFYFFLRFHYQLL